MVQKMELSARNTIPLSLLCCYPMREEPLNAVRVGWNYRTPPKEEWPASGGEGKVRGRQSRKEVVDL